ncbi:hypothetical protein [Phytoactinopolyspora halotolerans]|uniref:Nuclear transport factor 2 family protein n=1 Tax=Phytoactinopolyspora halotolerans TaxID=1981512 RepID=A0A6L9SBM2_9ACTN|nr:hypothetical protein [Phytoactinopolyspora halotolerans]NEE01410.1 hypothetical protein [Phytoactinopolyspora halotolerans]
MRLFNGRHVRRAVLAGIPALALTLAGCGGSDEDRAAGTAEDFFAALAEVDAEKACELNLGSDGQPLSEEHADWQSCLTGVDTWAGNTVMPADGELPEVSFDSVEIDGDTARLADSPPSEFSFMHAIDLRKVDEDWYIDGSWYR